MTLIAVMFLQLSCDKTEDGPLVQLFHPPKNFSRRFADFSANITGTLSEKATSARYCLNNGEWLPLAQGGSRIPKPQFIIEIMPERLLPGDNNLLIEAVAEAQPPETTSLTFVYDSIPPQLPMTVTWENPDLEVEDGFWDNFQDSSGIWRVRPTPGHEGYDRIVVVAGAFPGGRRIETDVIFRSNIEGKEFGFGVLAMWGGRPDEPGYHPRRGWNFSLTWYWNRYKGVGNEFSYKKADVPPLWVNSYYNLELERDKKYLIVIESWPEVDEQGEHICYRQLMKWWAEGTEEPKEWVDVTDIEGSPIPEAEYGIAFICYRSQVEYGPVTIKPLSTKVVKREPPRATGL